jgi:hypothetical protein
MLKFLRPGVTGEQIEKLGQIFAEGLAASKQPHIAVDARSPDIVISRRQVAVASDAIGLLTYDTEVLLALQTLWALVFVMFGKSMVTGADILSSACGSDLNGFDHLGRA